MDKWLQKKMEKLLRKDKEEEEVEAEVVEEEVEEEEEKVMMDIEERIEDLTQPNHVMETVNLMISQKLELKKIREEEVIEVEAGNLDTLRFCWGFRLTKTRNKTNPKCNQEQIEQLFTREPRLV